MGLRLGSGVLVFVFFFGTESVFGSTPSNLGGMGGWWWWWWWFLEPCGRATKEGLYPFLSRKTHIFSAT